MDEPTELKTDIMISHLNMLQSSNFWMIILKVQNLHQYLFPKGMILNVVQNNINTSSLFIMSQMKMPSSSETTECSLKN